MLPSPPPSSPARPALTNRTNVEDESSSKPVSLPPTPPQDRKRPRQTALDLAARKRAKAQSDEHEYSDENDSDVDVERVVVSRARRRTMFGMLDATRSCPPSTYSRLDTLPTRAILQSFVSSGKSDVFRCHSIHNDTYMSPPYACAYSYGAKSGKRSLLAVSTEQGAVHIFNTARREDWDDEPQRFTYRPHENGVFDVQWSHSDAYLATASADHCTCISQLTPTGPQPIYDLRHHLSTVKCVAWDPRREDNVLCTGSRDGMICLWDLRVGDADEFLKKPVMVINKSHGTGRTAGRKGKLTAPPARGVTSVCFSGCDEYGVISGGSYDGVLRQWDLRYLSSKRYTSGQNSVPKAITSPSLLSSADPTTYKGNRRARGITSLVVGSGASAGLLFALSNDSRVHTYDMSTLEPLSGWTEDPSNDLWSYGHENMHTNSFYVRLAMSPCGRWLASGGATNGSVYLFDVTSSSTNRRGPAFSDGRGLGVELQGQKGEVGAVDWAEGMVACCADDGTVRIWRQDLETYRSCEDDPEEMKWRWCWSANIR